jgi:hypothetical protein
MKTVILCAVALAGPLLMSSCVNVRPQRDPSPRVTTTTTQETTLRSRPSTTTVETQNVRAY